MKKIITITLCAALLSSCITGTKMQQVSGIENLNRNAYTLLPEKQSVSRTNRIWVLFFGFGGKSEEKREAQCYKRMLKDNQADGVMAGKFVHKKVTIPLIVFTYSYRFTTLTGKPFILKTDSVSVK